MPKKNRMNSVNTKSDGSCTGILVVIVILIIIVIIVGMMSRKKRYTCEYYKDQQLTTDQQCPANTPCKSNTTQDCMKKLNDVCPGCTTDQSPGPTPGPLPTGCNYTWEQVVLIDKTADEIKALESNYPSTGNVSFEVIAKAWEDAGMNPELAHFALIIAGGECEQPAQVNASCSLDKGSNASGIMQCDTCTIKAMTGGDCDKGKFGPDCQLNLFNPISNIWASVRTVLFPAKALNRTAANYDDGCQFQNQQSKTCIQQKGRGKGKNNFIGPFCHLQYQPKSLTQLTTGAWNGGGNTYQNLSFPDYYYDRFLANIGLSSPTDSNELKIKAETAAKACVNGKCPSPDPAPGGGGNTCTYKDATTGKEKTVSCFSGSSGPCINPTTKACFSKVGNGCPGGTVLCKGGNKPAPPPKPINWVTPKQGDPGVTWPIPLPQKTQGPVNMAWVATCYIESVYTIPDIKQLPYMRTDTGYKCTNPSPVVKPNTAYEQLNGVTAFAVTPGVLLDIMDNGDISNQGKGNAWPIAFSQTPGFKSMKYKWLCIGGGGYPWVPSDFGPDNIKKYVAFCKKYGYNGIQLDIETTKNADIVPAMIENALLWMKALGMTTSITPSWLPGNQAPPMPTIWRDLDWSYCDYIVTQLYAASGLWDGDGTDISSARRYHLAQAWFTHKASPDTTNKRDGVGFCHGQANVPWTGIQQCTGTPPSFTPKFTNTNGTSWSDKIIQGIPIKRQNPDPTTNCRHITYDQIKEIEQYSVGNKGCHWIIGGKWSGKPKSSS